MMRLYLILVIFFLIAASGCAKSPENKAREAISNYNRNLVIALKSDAKILKEVATERQQGRVDIYIKQLADDNKKLDAEIKTLDFNIVKELDEKEWKDVISDLGRSHRLDDRVPGHGALNMYKRGILVETNEIWSYDYLDIKKQKKSGESYLIEYSVKYLVVKENNKWKVADVKFTEKELNGS